MFRPVLLVSIIAIAAVSGTTIHGQASAPLSQSKLPGWDGSTTDAARAISSVKREALFRAAGARPNSDGKWTNCPDDSSGNSMAEVPFIGDLNGDGQLEAVVSDSGTFCNGMAGVNSTVLTQTKGGTWQVLYQNQGFVSFLISRGADGYPDIEAGLPGFCFPYFRWNGREYAMIAQRDPDGKACKPN